MEDTVTTGEATTLGGNGGNGGMPAPEPALTVAMIEVNVFALNEFGSPVPITPRPFEFKNTAEGPAAQHLIGWVAQNFMELPTVEATDEPSPDAQMFGSSWFGQGFFGGSPAPGIVSFHVVSGDSAFTAVQPGNAAFASVSSGDAEASTATATDTLPQMTLTPPNSYAIGATVTLTFTFLNSAGAVADPGAGNIYVRAPSGTITTTALSAATHPSTGIYTINVVPDAYGFWYYRAVSTSPSSASLDQYFNCEPTLLV